MRDKDRSIRGSASTLTACEGANGSLRRRKSRQTALDTSTPQRRGAASEAPVEKVVDRAEYEPLLKAVEKRAAELGVILDSKVWPKRAGKAVEIRCGLRKLGVLSAEDVRTLNVESLFFLQRTLVLDVFPPEGIDWTAWSRPLFAAQWGLGKLMTRAIDLLRLDRQRLAAKKAEKTIDDRTFVYRAITNERAQDEIRAEAARRYAKVKDERWKARSEFSLGGGTASAAQGVLMTAFTRWENGEIGYPSWTGPSGAIPIRASEIHKLSEHEDKEGRQSASCSIRITADGTPETPMVLRARGFNAQAQLRKILSKTYAFGGAKLWFDERRRKWQLGLSYASPRLPPTARGAECIAIVRSAEHMLFTMSSTGERLGTIATGAGLKIIQIRRVFGRKKGKIRKALHMQSKNARGHGRKRFFRPYTKASNDEARSVDTALKQLASAIRRDVLWHDREQTEPRGLKVVLVEDFSYDWDTDSKSGGDREFAKIMKRMPWAAAAQFLKNEFEEHAVPFKFVVAPRHVKECPECGHETEMIDGYVSCEGCGLFVQRVFASAWKMLKDSGASIEDTAGLRRRASYITRALREKKLEKAKAALAEGAAAVLDSEVPLNGAGMRHDHESLPPA